MGPPRTDANFKNHVKNDGTLQGRNPHDPIAAFQPPEVKKTLVALRTSCDWLVTSEAQKKEIVCVSPIVYPIALSLSLTSHMGSATRGFSAAWGKKQLWVLPDQVVIG